MPTQPNNLEVTDWLGMEALRLLTNPLEVAPAFNTDFQGNLEKEFPVGQTFRVPLPNNFLVTRQTMAYTPQPILDRHTTVTCDQTAQIGVEWDSIEQALSMPRGEDRVKKKILKPCMEKIRQEIDSSSANYATLNTPNTVGTLGTNPTLFDQVYGAADQRLTEIAGNMADKTMFLAPKLARALRNGAVAYFNPTDEIAKMFKKGYIGEVTGVAQSYQSMSLYSTTADSWQTPSSVTMSTTAGQSGSSLVLACTTGDTFTPGTPFTIASVNEVNPMTLRSTGSLKQFVITGAPVVGVASAATINIYPAIVGPGSPYQNVDALPGALATLVQYPGTTTPATGPQTGVNSLLIARDAFALVGVKLQNPKSSSAEIVAQEQDPDTGLSVAFLRMFDPNARKWINRFDSCWGFGTLWADHCAIRVMGA